LLCWVSQCLLPHTDKHKALNRFLLLMPQHIQPVAIIFVGTLF
jgi:hypothetical protein